MTDLQDRQLDGAAAEGSRGEPAWPAPGPGQWVLDRSHCPAGATPIGQEIVLRSMPVGFRRMFAELGTPLDTLSPAFVNGHFYSRLRPLISPDRPSAKLPPLPVLKLATRLHPEMRRRNRTAIATLRDLPWRQVIRDWHAVTRPRLVAANLALQDVDVEALETDELLAHVRACIEHAVASWEEHFRLHGYDLGPIGRFLHAATRWGVDPAELVALLEGASPSTTTPVRALAAIRAQLDAAGAHPPTLDSARAVSPGIAAAIDDYLAERRAVLFSRYDIDGVTLGERPDLLLASILDAVVDDRSPQVIERIGTVRQRVPAGERTAFDELLAQARDAMDLRDDNGPVTVAWTLGLVRLALLGLGRRLVAAGVWPEAELALELRSDEIGHGLFTAVPAPRSLARRRELRAAQRTLVPPVVIGPAEAAPPLAALPPALADLVGMVTAVMRHLGMDAADQSPAALAGHGIGTQPVRGRALVVDGADEALARLQPGDVLVVNGTTPAYNLVLSLVAGVVTSVGGPMSHAAVLARELGLPAVIGARGALTQIADGDLVEVDPVAGEVRVLAAV